MSVSTLFISPHFWQDRSLVLSILLFSFFLERFLLFDNVQILLTRIMFVDRLKYSIDSIGMCCL